MVEINLIAIAQFLAPFLARRKCWVMLAVVIAETVIVEPSPSTECLTSVLSSFPSFPYWDFWEDWSVSYYGNLGWHCLGRRSGKMGPSSREILLPLFVFCILAFWRINHREWCMLSGHPDCQRANQRINLTPLVETLTSEHLCSKWNCKYSQRSCFTFKDVLCFKLKLVSIYFSKIEELFIAFDRNLQ